MTTFKVMIDDDQITAETIRLRSKYRIRLPDFIISATALAGNQFLLTNNIADFSSLDDKVKFINPFTL